MRRTDRPPLDLRPGLAPGATPFVRAFVRATPFVTALLFVLLSSAHAATTKGMVILLRALAYDRGFDERITGSVDVAVLYRSGVASSESCRDQTQAAEAEIGEVKLRGHEIHLSLVDLTTVGLEATKDAELWYVCPGLDADLPAIVERAQSQRRLTASESRALVESGIVLGVEEGPNDTELYVNLPASKRAGAEFSSQLLGATTVIR